MQICRFLPSAAVLAAATVVAACASTEYNYSQVSGTRYYRVPIDTYPVMVLRVDDKDVPTSQRSNATVEPGQRKVTVQAPPGSPGGIGEQRTVDLRIAPCTRYYLVAVKTSSLANDFTVRVEHQEPLSGCTPA